MSKHDGYFSKNSRVNYFRGFVFSFIKQSTRKTNAGNEMRIGSFTKTARPRPLVYYTIPKHKSLKRPVAETNFSIHLIGIFLNSHGSIICQPEFSLFTLTYKTNSLHRVCLSVCLSERAKLKFY